MAGKIINRSFKAGDCFQSMVNGEQFVVVQVQQPGVYVTRSGGIGKAAHTIVWFRHLASGAVSGMQIESAKRLLLQKLPSAAAKELAAGSI